jgi:hypothetical protein
VAFVPIAVRARNALAWGALPFVGIAVVLSAEVWAEPFNWARAVAPIWTAVPFVIMARTSHPSAVPGGQRLAVEP